MKSQLRKHLWFSRMVFALSLGLLFLPTGCDPSTSATPSASSPPSSVSVAIVPLTATVPEGGSLSFLATVKGVADTTVRWSVTGGSITSSGVYTAPNTVGIYSVVATSVADAKAFDLVKQVISAVAFVDDRPFEGSVCVLDPTSMHIT